MGYADVGKVTAGVREKHKIGNHPFAGYGGTRVSVVENEFSVKHETCVEPIEDPIRVRYCVRFQPFTWTEFRVLKK